MHSRRSVGAALLLFAVCGVATRGVACGYHGGLGEGFSAQHPRSIEVAMAVRRALDEGVLASPKVLPPFLAFGRANRTLDEARRVLAADFERSKVGVGFALLLVEAGLWSRYHVDAGYPVLDVHVSSPLPGDDIVITAEPVLQAILDAHYSIEQAIGDGLIVVASSTTGSGAIIRDALRRAFNNSVPGKATHRTDPG